MQLCQKLDAIYYADCVPKSEGFRRASIRFQVVRSDQFNRASAPDNQSFLAYSQFRRVELTFSSSMSEARRFETESDTKPARPKIQGEVDEFQRMEATWNAEGPQGSCNLKAKPIQQAASVDRFIESLTTPVSACVPSAITSVTSNPN